MFAFYTINKSQHLFISSYKIILSDIAPPLPFLFVVIFVTVQIIH